MPSPASPSGVAEISAPLGRGVRPADSVALGDGQLRHAQTAARASVAEEASTVCVPLHSDQFQLAELGGALVRELSDKAIKRASFVSVPDLKQAIEEFLRSWNENPKPFIWTATVEGIMTKIERARVKMEQIQPGSTLPRSRKKKGIVCTAI